MQYTVEENADGIVVRVPGGVIIVHASPPAQPHNRPVTIIRVIDQDRYTMHGVEYGARKGAIVTLLGRESR